MNVQLQITSREEILAPLRKVGIEAAEVQYSGYGDEGAVNDIIITPPGIEDPGIEDYIRRPILDQLPDWWNNEGGGGVLTIDVKEGTITARHYTNETIEHWEDWDIVGPPGEEIPDNGREASFDKVLAATQELIEGVPTEEWVHRLHGIQGMLFELRDS